MWQNLLMLLWCQGRRPRRLCRSGLFFRSGSSFVAKRTPGNLKMTDKQTLVVVSGNKKKLDELILLLGDDFPFQLTGLSVDLPEYQGEPEDITRTKCQEAAKLLNKPVLVEDTSLEFKALNGLPGPYVKWFFDKIGPEGLHRMLLGWEDKTAVAVCNVAMTLGSRNDQILLFRGEMTGRIVPPRGNDGFGWGACFQPDGLDQTVAELTPEVKHRVSHRAMAIIEIKEFFARQKQTNETKS